MPAQSDADPVDALDTIPVQDTIIADLLGTWRAGTERLLEGDDVDTRWERGSAAKLLLQHFAVREAAKNAVTAALQETGEEDLATALEGDGVGRREAMDRADKAIRGRQAMSLNNPDVDQAIDALGEYFDKEHSAEVQEVVPAAERVFGPAGQRELPSARQVRLTSTTHPSPVPRWYDNIGPLRALRAFYQHLRGTPTGGTSPGLDAGREHTPGMKP